MMSHRNVVRDLLAADFDTFTPKGIIHFMSQKKYKQIADLSIKEFFCYLSVVRPTLFNSDLAVTFGSGSRRGAVLLGCISSSNANTEEVHAACMQLAS